MALVKCKECGNEVSSSAKSCPKCGAKPPRKTSALTWVVVGVFGLAVFQCTSSMEQAGRRSEGSKTAEAVRLASLNPEQQAAEQKERAAALGLVWSYSENDEKMGRGKVKRAYVSSLNEENFGFPYNGAQRAIFHLRKHPTYGKDVVLSISQGQFNCRVSGCSVALRFDDGKAQSFHASEPTDNKTTVLFIDGYDTITSRLRKAKKLYVEAEFYQEGRRVFEFDVSGLKWQ